MPTTKELMETEAAARAALLEAARKYRAPAPQPWGVNGSSKSPKFNLLATAARYRDAVRAREAARSDA